MALSQHKMDATSTPAPTEPLPPNALTVSPFLLPDFDPESLDDVPPISLDLLESLDRHQPPQSPALAPRPASPAPSEDDEEWEEFMKLELQKLKELFLQRRYKECTAQCAELLPAQDDESAHKAFVHFYAALSFEEMARSQHHQSPNVLSNIDLAAQHYHAASEALPAPIIPERRKSHVFTDEQRQMTMIDFAVNLRADAQSIYSSAASSARNSVASESDVVSLTSASTAPSSAPPASPTDSKDGEHGDDWFVALDEVTWDETEVRRPSPLRIRKGEVVRSPETSWLSLESESESDSDSDSDFEDEQEWPEEARDVRHLLQDLCEPSQLQQPRALLRINKRAVQRFNEHLTAFYDILENHVEGLSRLRESVMRMRARDIEPITKEERISRGRQRNWERKRFDPEKYQELCDEATMWA